MYTNAPLSRCDDDRLAHLHVNPVRTALYGQISNYIVKWGGIGDSDSEECEFVEAINLDTLCMHRPALARAAAAASRPCAARSGTGVSVGFFVFQVGLF